ncbi:Tubulin polyglutamylase TTLL4 [Taenia crassiceps]|uniref:Tubulin polyglutamylase TTLL4 n=1 Tax=Taenia crassiceps TaxID=6207 RepID=A0ABR4QKK2_9CEST
MTGIEICDLRNPLINHWDADSVESVEQLNDLSYCQIPMYSGQPWMHGGNFVPSRIPARAFKPRFLFEHKKSLLNDFAYSTFTPLNGWSTFSRPDFSVDHQLLKEDIEYHEHTEKSISGNENCISEKYRWLYMRDKNVQNLKCKLKKPSKGRKISPMRSSLNSGCNSGSAEFDIDVEDGRDSDEDFALSSDNKSISKPQILSPIIISLFPAIPPFLRFVKEDEAVTQLPPSLMAKLIWRNTTITPNVVKRTLERSHFRLTESCYCDWIGCFGRHLTPVLFRQVKDFQKLNHFPGSFELGRKDLLTINLSKMRTRFGSENFGFYPTTFILPREFSRLKDSWGQGLDRNSARSKKRNLATWIIKPPASARGVGIYLANRLTEVPRRKKSIAQLYISNPYLIGGNKFDLRLYVYMTSVDPLRLYIHKNGLVRFASQKYSNTQEQVSNRFVHLTNYSVNKRNIHYYHCGGSTDQPSHKWSLEELWQYLEERGSDTRKLWRDIKSIVFKTMASAVSKMASLVVQHVNRRESVHELFGFDILLDSELRPWLLEVNISPSLHTSTKLDNKVKSEVVVDMLNLAGFRVPPRSAKEEVKRASSSQKKLHENGAGRRVNGDSPGRSSLIEWGYKRLPIHNPEQLRYNLTNAEKKKHRAYAARSQSPPDMKTILDDPTTDDTLMLATTINEWYRASSSASMMSMIDSAGGDGPSMYSGQLGTPRYYDALLYQFVQRFGTPLVDEASSVFVSGEGVKETPPFVTKLAEQHIPRISSAPESCKLLETKRSKCPKASPLPASSSTNFPRRTLKPPKISARSVGRLPRASESHSSPLPNIRRSSLKSRFIGVTCQSARQSCRWTSQVPTTSTRSQATTHLLSNFKLEFPIQF